MLVIFLLYFVGTLIPSIHTLLEVGGSILGTLINIVIPVLFYNRAYSGDLKHLLKEHKNRHINERDENRRSKAED